MSEKLHHGNKWMPVMYVTYYGMLSEIAKEYGYALAVHGSVTRDFDLIAVAWVENPKPHLELIKAIAEKVGVAHGSRFYDTVEEKPHNRIAYTIHCGAGGYFDISVIKPK